MLRAARLAGKSRALGGQFGTRIIKNARGTNELCCFEGSRSNSIVLKYSDYLVLKKCSGGDLILLGFGCSAEWAVGLNFVPGTRTLK